MNVLATLYSPSLDLVGPESLTALAVASVFAVASSRFNGSEKNRKVAMRWGPIALLVLSMFEEGSVTFNLWPIVRVHPGASDYAAGYICYAFGFIFGLNLLKQGGYEDRMIGMVLSALHGGFIVGSGAALWAMISSETDYTWLATLAFAACWSVVVMVWQARRSGAPLSTQPHVGE